MHVAFYIISLMNTFFKMKGPTIINLKIYISVFLILNEKRLFHRQKQLH